MYSIEFEFHKQRNIRQLINDSYNFWSQNFSKLGFAIFIGSLPFFLLIFVALPLIIFNVENQIISYDPNKYVYITIGAVFIILWYLMIICVLYSYITLYINYGRDGINSVNLWSLIGKSYFKILLLHVVYAILVALGGILFIIPGIYLLVALYPAAFIAIYENTSIFTAIKRSICIVRENWWNTFGLLIVVYFVINIIVSNVLTAVGYALVTLLIFALVLLTISSSQTYTMSMPQFIIISVIAELIACALTYGMSIAQTMPPLVIIFQYFNTLEDRAEF